MFIDAHQHFWKYNPVEYGWIGPEMHELKRDFLPEDLLKELTGIGFSGSIAVQARQKFEETLWLLDLAGKHNFIKGVVGWVDLCSEDIMHQLEVASKSKKFVGVRHVLQDEPDENFMLRKEFLTGISNLEKYGLTYDLLIFPKHLNAANKLVKMFPKQQFVIDHIAKPDIKNARLKQWYKDILKISENKNVYCKISGMVTETDTIRWKPSDFTPYLYAVFEAFGPERLMIGSDWPVCTVAGKYSRVMSIVTDYIEPFKEETRNKILGENCSRFYLKKN